MTKYYDLAIVFFLVGLLLMLAAWRYGWLDGEIAVPAMFAGMGLTLIATAFRPTR